jgi:Fe-S cluster assembly protein SufD
VGHLDELAQYYMRSRGIPEREARVLQMISFLAPVLQHLPEEVRDDLTARVESELRAL